MDDMAGATVEAPRELRTSRSRSGRNARPTVSMRPTSTAAMKAIYVLAGVSIALLTMFRIMTAKAGKTATRPRRAEGAAG